MGPFLVSHHPHCGPFRPDVLVVGRRRLCTACFVGYPFIAVGWLGAWAASGTVPLAWWAWAAIGLALAAPQGLSFAGRIRSARTQVLVKASLGTGLGLVCHAALALPLELGWRIAALVAALMAIQSLWVLRFHRLERTCQACPQLALRPRCEGLADLDTRLQEVLAPAGGWIRVR
jgi:hypothetical protein